jgi:hypothetical protein
MRASALFAWLVVMAIATSAAAQIRHLPPLADPARDLIRFEVRLTTDARFASVRVVTDATLVGAQGRRLVGPADLRTAVLDNLLALSGNVEGDSATGAFRVILVRATLGTVITWQLNVQEGHRATIDIIDLNNEQQPRAVDHFEGAAGATFTTNVTQLRVNGTIQLAAPESRLVLAHYYPWYERGSWADPRMIDQPLTLYSTDIAADVLAELKLCQHAGLDGVIVSWQGSEGNQGWNHRRMLLVLQAAQQLGMKVSTLFETQSIPTDNKQAQLDGLVQWLTEIVDWYGSQPAYLKVNGRPVIFLWAWIVPGDAMWHTALDRVRATGRNPYVIADTTNVDSLAVADSEFTYGGTLFTDDVEKFTTSSVMATRTYHLLDSSRGAQRLAVAAVSPGYDDRNLPGRDRYFFFDREGGALYNRQWQAAVGSGADWIVVTTWNEWLENTQIEPSQRYGDLYRWMTSFFATIFKKSPRS